MSVIIIGGGGDHHAAIDQAHANIRCIAVALGRNAVTPEQGAKLNEILAQLHTFAEQVKA